jgi:hypothetical protein
MSIEEFERGDGMASTTPTGDGWLVRVASSGAGLGVVDVFGGDARCRRLRGDARCA